MHDNDDNVSFAIVQDTTNRKYSYDAYNYLEFYTSIII